MKSSYQPNLFFNAKELESKTLLKKDLAILCEAPLSLLERKVMNVLLLTAQANLKTQETYFITVGDLAYLTGFDSHNNNYLKKTLGKLRDISIKWNILGQDSFGEHSLLAGYIYKKGIIEYSFDPLLKKYFLDEYLTYTKLLLAVQKKFKRAYSIPIYEICQKYFDVKRKRGETPFLKISTIRKLCGLQEGQYRETKSFLRGVIKTSIAEINQESDLWIEAPLLQRENRNIVAIKFKIQPNPLHWEKNNPYGKGKVKEELTPQNDELFMKLTQQGILSKKAKTLLQTHSTEKIQKSLNALEKYKGTVKNTGGWLIAAIESTEEWTAKSKLCAFEKPFMECPEKERLAMAAKLKARADQWRFHSPNKEIPTVTKQEWVTRIKQGESL